MTTIRNNDGDRATWNETPLARFGNGEDEHELRPDPREVGAFVDGLVVGLIPLALLVVAFVFLKLFD